MTDRAGHKEMRPSDHDERVGRARVALEGVAVGDAFGELFFDRYNREVLMPRRALPDGPWPYTDDTAMAMSIVDVLTDRGRIDQDELAARFAERFVAQPGRGYGPGTFALLMAIARGADWRGAARSMFGGQGSWGNGSAMRVAPVGGYFADDPAEAARQARASAAVTHAHGEGQAGAIAVGVAAAMAWQLRNADDADRGAVLIDAAIEHTPESEVHAGLRKAAKLDTDRTDRAAAVLGSGTRISCPDTVPFCIWCAARHLDSFAEALWATASGLGDVDTTCAIVGGIVALATGIKGIPPEWLARREDLQ